jgi:ApaG protein
MARKPTFDTMAVLFPYVATTRDVTVRVAVSYLAEQSDPRADRWFWSYHIRIENGGSNTVQLRTRRWRIVDGRGAVHEVQGEGVVGETPAIPPGGSFDYVSGCPLSTSSGSMSGSYRFIDDEGAVFDVAIPTFPLLGPAA